MRPQTLLNRSRMSHVCMAVGASLALASCTQVDHQQELRSNKLKWEAAAISSYELDMQQGCFCPDFITRPIHLVVRNSEISLTYTDDGSSVIEDALESLLIGPIPKMFDGIKFVIDNDPDDLKVIYNEEYGFPERIAADPISSAIDDEFGFRVSNFRLVDDS